MIEQLLGFISATTTADEPEKNIPKNPDATDLELRNSANATERHLLEIERQCNQSILSLVGLDLSISLGLNASVTWLVLNCLQTLTPDFSGLTFHFLSMSVNTLATLPYLANDRVNKKYLFPLTLGRIALGYSVNGRIIQAIESRIITSKQNLIDLKTEIQAYENGYKTPKNDFVFPGFNEVSIVLLIVGGIAMVNKLFQSGN
jgi:hypothetical protein